MSTHRTPPQTQCPADVLGFIPWYPDGLDETQRGAVEAHAAGCSDCRDEIAMLQGSLGLQGSDLAESGEAPDPERIYAQVLARMEAAPPDVLRREGGTEDGERAKGAKGASVSQLPLRQRSDAPDEPQAMGWRRVAGASSGKRVALAASLLLALAVGALVGPGVLRRGGEPEPVYETASASTSAQEGATKGHATLEVVFREDANASQINQTLRALGARVTSGPSQLGVYRLELGADVDLTAAKKLLTEDRDGVATFAEKPLRP